MAEIIYINMTNRYTCIHISIHGYVCIYVYIYIVKILMACINSKTEQ